MTAYERRSSCARSARFLKKSASEMSISAHFVFRLHASIGVRSPAHQAMGVFLSGWGLVAWHSFLILCFLNGAP